MDSIREELDRSRQELREVNLMLDQSQLEVSKLAQRNASVTTQLQQILSHFDSLPRGDIRLAYEAALDAQQRLFVMRGQLEKLQGDQKRLKQYTTILDQVLQALEANRPADSKAPRMGRVTDTVEMIIQAQEAERQRLSRQMHDGPAQALSNFILQTEIALRLFEIDQVKAKEELASLKRTATTTFQKVRDFIFELRPMMLDDLGLIPTLKRYVDAFKDHPGLELRLRVIGQERRLESYMEVMIFRAVQEILNNALQQSQAGQINVQVDIGNQYVRVIVEEDGRSVDPDTLEEQGNMGLKLIRERVEMLGGELEIEGLDGQGTRVVFQVPAGEPAG
jgi:two-component system sensor histidine kinase DegS